MFGDGTKWSSACHDRAQERRTDCQNTIPLEAADEGADLDGKMHVTVGVEPSAEEEKDLGGKKGDTEADSRSGANG